MSPFARLQEAQDLTRSSRRGQTTQSQAWVQATRAGGAPVSNIWWSCRRSAGTCKHRPEPVRKASAEVAHDLLTCTPRRLPGFSLLTAPRFGAVARLCTCDGPDSEPDRARRARRTGRGVAPPGLPRRRRRKFPMGSNRVPTAAQGSATGIRVPLEQIRLPQARGGTRGGPDGD
jgi:hypothetical protein